LVFCFFDACSVLSGGLADYVLQNGGLKGRPTLDQLITQGKYPCYGCGWTKEKEILFAKRLANGHVDYIAQWWKFATDPDPQDPNLFANDYATTRARAIFNPGSFKDENPYSDNWDFRGYEEAYLDY
jgi:hypothetical protein